MQTLQGVEKRSDFKFSDYTTYGLGGYAKCAYFPKTEQEAIAVIKYLNSSKEKYVILGCGSNVLAADGFYDGSVVSTRRLKSIRQYGKTLYCSSGTTVNELLKFCVKNGLGGLEYLAGIPASLGGLALMNGGIPSRHIGDDILSVVHFDGRLHEITHKNCNFGNKYSTMRDIDTLIIGINLSICAVSREAVQKKIASYLEVRRNQPKGKNCGCVFKNPKGLSAGKLIDECGLKGLKLGCAEVSREHANFIINSGNRAEDVYKLINQVKQRVYEYSGVMLDEEVVYIGEFNDFDS